MQRNEGISLKTNWHLQVCMHPARVPARSRESPVITRGVVCSESQPLGCRWPRYFRTCRQSDYFRLCRYMESSSRSQGL